jgi:hypothetical protein
MAKKKAVPLTTEDKFYNAFKEMSKVNFLGMIMKKYFREKIIGKEETSIEYAEIQAILKLLEEKFSD